MPLPNPMMTLPKTSLLPLKTLRENPITGPLPVNRDWRASVMPGCQPRLSTATDGCGDRINITAT